MAKIALFDMDGTLADYADQMQRGLEDLRGLPKEPTYDMWDPMPPYMKARMRLIKSQTGWWRNLPKLDIGFEILEVVLSIGYDVHVLTKGPWRTTSAWTEKVEWCREHLPKSVKVTITEDKSIVYGRVLVDDYTTYMKEWLAHRPRGLGIMPTAPNNEDFEHDQVIHYGDFDNIDVVRDRLQLAFDREDGRGKTDEQ